jgi:transcriptional regulator with XRE-family HTH domain
VRQELVAASIIHRLRAQAGLTQTELAARAGLSRPVLSAYENGRRQPGVAVLARLADAVGATLTVADRRSPGIDPAVNGAKLYDVLSLVDAMPVDSRRRPPLPVLDVWRR